MAIAVQFTNGDLERLLSDTIADAKTHESYILKNSSNQTTRMRATKIRTNLEKIQSTCNTVFHGLLLQVQHDVKDELELLRFQNDSHAVTISRLDARINQLLKENQTLKEELAESRKELDEAKKERDEAKEQLDTSKRNALRRQIAVNIEYEVKKELLALKKPNVSEQEVQFTPFYQLQDLYSHSQDERVVAISQKWFGGVEWEHWERFNSAIAHLKNCFNEKAHPIGYNGDLVTKEVALQLVKETFASYGRRQRYPWNSVKRLAENLVMTLASEYRSDGEQLLYC